MNSAFTILQLISLIVCAIVAIKYFRKLFVPEFVLLIVIKTYTLLFTVIMQGSLKDYVYSFVWLICEIILISYYLRFKRKLGIKTVCIALAILVYINLASIIMFPEGMYNFGSERIYTFLGACKYYIGIFIPIICYFNIADKTKQWRWFSRLNIIVCVISTILIQSATAYVVYAVFISLNIIFAIKKRFPKGMFFTIYIIIMLLSVGIIFFKIQNIFGFLIKNILHRELNFTNRDYYWGITINYIKNNLLGYGYVAGTARIGGLGSHDSLLEILLKEALYYYFIYTVWFQKNFKIV